MSIISSTIGQSYPYQMYRKRKYTQDEDFFDTPNILNSFIAGFIAADGNVRRKSGSSNNSTLSINISKKDIDYLRNIKMITKASSPITFRSRLTCCGNEIDLIDWHVYSRKWLNDLESNFGIVENKRRNSIAPIKLVGENRLAFIIGYIDGDGCITVLKYKYGKNKDLVYKSLRIGIAGQEPMLLWIKDVFDEICPPTNKISNVLKHTASNSYAYILAGERARRIYEILEPIKLPKMDRKWSRTRLIELGVL